MTAWFDNRLSCDREPLIPPPVLLLPRFVLSNFVTDFVRFNGFDLNELRLLIKEFFAKEKEKDDVVGGREMEIRMLILHLMKLCAIKV